MLKRFAVMAATFVALTAMAQADAPKTLPSGVIFQSLKNGSGKHPTATDVVTVHYRGTLMDGTEFDSSYKRGQPASFRLNQVIPCWTEGVQRMQPGGKAKLTCPGSTAA
jgi:FKBP-type peptidyl-prolyl cis-trans isomerase FkpA